ncbi:MAG: tRNA (guanine(10)-N(2))-dimethyltransferase [Candidatus Anstonellaceae archaeon]
MRITEGAVRLSIPKGVFYNPQMRLCRTLCSLAVGALEKEISVADVMCASGVRGLRYKKENDNVGTLVLCDRSKAAVECARKNASANKVKCSIKKQDASLFLQEGEFDFVELDPFGSPALFLFDACRCLAKKKEGFLSITATDTAVLCGAHHSACIKNYGAVPANNEMCHENAVRILIGKTAICAAQFNLGVIPIFTLSHRHYIKVIFKVRKGARGAVESVKSTGFGLYCTNCLARFSERMPSSLACPACNFKLSWAGPLWMGQLWEKSILEKMTQLNQSKNFEEKDEISRLLLLLWQECEIGRYGYYDLHEIASKTKQGIISVNKMVSALRAEGFAASRTHFCPTAVRTNAPIEAIKKAMGGGAGE